MSRLKKRKLKATLLTLALLGVFTYALKADRTELMSFMAGMLLFLEYVVFTDLIQVSEERDNLRWILHLSHGESKETLEQIAEKSETKDETK